jgi:hypothetical protein
MSSLRKESGKQSPSQGVERPLQWKLESTEERNWRP